MVTECFIFDFVKHVWGFSCLSTVNFSIQELHGDKYMSPFPLSPFSSSPSPPNPRDLKKNARIPALIPWAYMSPPHKTFGISPFPPHPHLQIFATMFSLIFTYVFTKHIKYRNSKKYLMELTLMKRQMLWQTTTFWSTTTYSLIHQSCQVQYSMPN